MKKQILEIIFARFENWSKQFGFACNKGCAVCCTTDVSVTALEGKLLLDYIIHQHGPEWLSEKLGTTATHRPLSKTTNEYAKACLEGREVEIGEKRLGGDADVDARKGSAQFQAPDQGLHGGNFGDTVEQLPVRRHLG